MNLTFNTTKENKTMEVLFIMAAFGVVTGLAATGKNRSFLPWFIIGLFTGVFGLIAACVVKAMPEGHEGL